MKIIDRYLLQQMAGPFLFGVLAFVMLFVSANILFELMDLINTLGIGLWTAGVLFVLRLPGFMVYTFPLATLVAILISFGRLSGDSELIAMHAGGISFRRLVAPLVGAGIFVSLLTAGLNEYIVPACNHTSENIIRAAAGKSESSRENVFYQDRAGAEVSRLVYAERLDLATGELTRPIITWLEDGRPAMLTVAEKGQWRGSNWDMIDGANYLLQPERQASWEFDRWTTKFTTSPQQIALRSRKPEEMTYRELSGYIKDLLDKDLPVTQLELTLHHKISIPFSCLVFALIAPPLGMRSHRGSSSIGMGIAILIGFGYYVIWNYLAIVAQQGHLSPLWAAWLPNLITGAIGITLILSVKK